MNMKKLRWVVIPLVLMIASPSVLGLTINTAGVVRYTAFDATSYTLKPWLGQRITALTPTGIAYDTNVMSKIVWTPSR